MWEGSKRKPDIDVRVTFEVIGAALEAVSMAVNVGRPPEVLSGAGAGMGWGVAVRAAG